MLLNTCLDDDYRIKSSLRLFDDLKCRCDSVDKDSNDQDYKDDVYYNTVLSLVDEDKMRRHIINCITALF